MRNAPFGRPGPANQTNQATQPAVDASSESGTAGAAAGGGPGGGHGGHGGGGHGGGHPPGVEAIDAWVDAVLEAGGIALPDAAATYMDGVADRLEADVAAGVDNLPGAYARHLEAVVRDLGRIAEHGDRTLGGPQATTGDTAMDRAIHKIDEFLDYEGANLSDAVVARLQAAQTQLETVYADEVLSADEQDEVAAAAATVQEILDGDFAMLSDAGLADLTGMAEDARTLADTGFLALDADQLAVFQQVRTDLDALDTDDGSQGGWAVHEIVDDLRFEVGGQYLHLADYLMI